MLITHRKSDKNNQTHIMRTLFIKITLNSFFLDAHVRSPMHAFLSTDTPQ
jgi:hypothetical protein